MVVSEDSLTLLSDAQPDWRSAQLDAHLGATLLANASEWHGDAQPARHNAWLDAQLSVGDLALDSIFVSNFALNVCGLVTYLAAVLESTILLFHIRQHGMGDLSTSLPDYIVDMTPHSQEEMWRKLKKKVK